MIPLLAIAPLALAGLDGRTFSGTTGVLDQAESGSDEIRFAGGELLSTECAK